jgi:histidine ammonia-lyase
VYRAVRARVAHYRDDRPLHVDIERVRDIIRVPMAVDVDADDER